jgi:signal transduction histidine kinase
MAPRRSSGLTLRLALASLGSAVAVGIVCVVGLVSLRNLSSVTRSAVTRQIVALDESRAFASLLYQKGFLAQYMLTADRRWVAQIDIHRHGFERWLASASDEASTARWQELLERIRTEYAAYDSTRRRALELFEAGGRAQAVQLLSEAQDDTEKLLALIQAFGELRRKQAEDTLRAAEASTWRLAGLLVATSVLGALASVAAGYFWARRITRPIYELRLRAESAAHRTRIQVDPGSGDLDGLAAHVTALVARVEEMDGALIEHRRRLAQNEKLSEIGELAAKLAHELLNPIAGMKAAIQLLARGVEAGRVQPDEVRETAGALDREITRVEQLVRRLVDYARPLSPRFEVCQPSRLVEAALQASRREIARSEAVVHQTVEAGLPPLEADPLLVTQALSNLICNAAQATPLRGSIDLALRRLSDRGRDQVVFEVADRGAGLAEDTLPRLFRPFFTTKPAGHGLGLAVSQHIVVEHGGRITARNREGGGAVFEVAIPVVR